MLLINPPRNAMLTSAECRARAEQKIAEAELQPRHERKLRTPAEGRLVLADPMERLEASMRVGEPESPRRGIFLGQPGLMTPPIFRASLIQQQQSAQPHTLRHAPRRARPQDTR